MRIITDWVIRNVQVSRGMYDGIYLWYIEAAENDTGAVSRIM